MILKLVIRLLILFSLTSSFALGMELPQKLNKLLKAKSKGEEIDPLLRYEAIMDTYNQGKMLMISGNSSKALQLLKVGISEFPYDSRIMKSYQDGLQTYISNLNEAIKKGQMNCKSIEERIEFLMQISPDSISQLAKGQCKDFLVNDKALQKDVLSREFLDMNIPVEITGSSFSSSHQRENSLYTKISRKEAMNKSADKVYTLEFPKQHVLANALKYLGHFSFSLRGSDAQFLKRKEGDYFFTNTIDFERKGNEITYEGLCRRIKPFFSLNHVGTLRLDKQVQCGVKEKFFLKRALYTFMNGKETPYSSLVNVMKGGGKYINRKGSAFNNFLPRYLAFDLTMEYNNRSIKKEVVFEIRDAEDFLIWFELLPFNQSIRKNRLISDKNLKNVLTKGPPVQVVGEYPILLSSVFGGTISTVLSKDKIKGFKGLVLNFNRRKTYDLAMKRL